MLASESPHPRTGASAVGLPARVVDALLWLYHVTISPLLGSSCRFAPSCSVYARDAVRRYGVMRGGWLAVRRLARCHPRHPGGWDPVV